MAAIPCTTCGTTLTPHCSSPTCHWWECRGDCPWMIYDLDLGSRRNRHGVVERMGTDGRASAPDA